MPPTADQQACSFGLSGQPKLSQQLRIVLAKRRRRAGNAAWCGRKPGRHAGKAGRTLRRVNRLEEPDRVELLVVKKLVGRAQARSRNVQLAQQVQPFLRRTL